jgi:alpha-mannosidase
VKDWNAKHEYPRLVIATTAEMFREFERRYADKIPVVRGDFTPYWEDGAASSARETALNRPAAERLVQAETLWAMLRPMEYPGQAFVEAWRNVLLYDEHTWGARQYNVTNYDVPFITDQWRIKQAFALDGDAQSRKLLDAAFSVGGGAEVSNAVDVFNTTSWARTDLVVLPGKARGDVVMGPDGEAVPSQRFSTGELAFLAKKIPPLAGRRYMIGAGQVDAKGRAKAQAASLATPSITVQLDPKSGSIVSLRSAGINAELSDMKSGMGLNRYCYVVRDRLKEPLHESRAKIAVKESGPLVASLRVESDAPGCVKLTREIRVVDGLDRVDIVNVLDKKEVREKEGVHLGFAFNVPDGVMRIDIPWAVFRPEVDQIPGACKEWLSVGRWADVSNQDYGITWATLDAPIIEVGSLAAKLGKSEDPESWRSRIEPSQTLYSYVMNNYWITNYRAFQSGPTTFRYCLLPHKQYDLAAAQRFGIECSQPLVVATARGAAPSGRPFLDLDTPEVIVASIKPSEDRKALIVRLFGAAGRPAKATLRWAGISPRTIWMSNLAEEPVAAVAGAVHVPAFGLVTLRVE